MTSFYIKTTNPQYRFSVMQGDESLGYILINGNALHEDIVQDQWYPLSSGKGQLRILAYRSSPLKWGVGRAENLDTFRLVLDKHVVFPGESLQGVIFWHSSKEVEVTQIELSSLNSVQISWKEEKPNRDIPSRHDGSGLAPPPWESSSVSVGPPPRSDDVSELSIGPVDIGPSDLNVGPPPPPAPKSNAPRVPSPSIIPAPPIPGPPPTGGGMRNPGAPIPSPSIPGPPPTIGGMRNPGDVPPSQIPDPSIPGPPPTIGGMRNPADLPRFGKSAFHVEAGKFSFHKFDEVKMSILQEPKLTLAPGFHAWPVWVTVPTSAPPLASSDIGGVSSRFAVLARVTAGAKLLQTSHSLRVLTHVNVVADLPLPSVITEKSSGAAEISMACSEPRVVYLGEPHKLQLTVSNSSPNPLTDLHIKLVRVATLRGYADRSPVSFNNDGILHETTKEKVILKRHVRQFDSSCRFLVAPGAT
jgi:hypothetical protein